MNSSADLAWCSKPGLFWKAVVAIYSESKKVHDCEGMYSFLRVAEKSSFGKLKPVLDGGEKKSFGKLKLILGGKSVGKSLVL
jgi:hypothetical protein